MRRQLKTSLSRMTAVRASRRRVFSVHLRPLCAANALPVRQPSAHENALFWLVSIIAFQYLSKKRSGRSLRLSADSEVDQEQVSNYAVASVANRSQSASLGRSCMRRLRRGRKHVAKSVGVGRHRHDERPQHPRGHTLKLKKLALHDSGMTLQRRAA